MGDEIVKTEGRHVSPFARIRRDRDSEGNTQ